MKVSDIRPDALLNRYLELSAHDADVCFAGVQREDIPCVACGNSVNEFQFEKNGFPYALCPKCGTLFQSPRPSMNAFEEFYRNSESSRYWADVFFPAVAEIRREKIFRPRVERLDDLCKAQGINVRRIMDIGAGFGIFLDEWRRRFPGGEFIAVEPSESLAAECRAKGFNVLQQIAENVVGYDNYADIVVCFEVLEHVYNPLNFLKVLVRFAKPGGYVFVSSLSVDGFDFKILWEKSTQIFPPHHINFLSIEGFKNLFNRAGLDNVIITTPGKLDVDIVNNALKYFPGLLDNQRFIKDLLADNVRSANFQLFLSENCLSSHTWTIGKKIT